MKNKTFEGYMKEFHGKQHRSAPAPSVMYNLRSANFKFSKKQAEFVCALLATIDASPNEGLDFAETFINTGKI